MRSPGSLDRRVLENVDEEELSAHLGHDVGDLREWLGFHDLPEADWAVGQVESCGSCWPG